VDLYDIRAQILNGLIKSEEIENQLQKAIDHFHSEDYRFNRQYNALAMRTRTALSITRLMAMPSISRTVLMDCALAFLSSRSNTFRAGDVPIFASLALDRSLHKQILSEITAQANTVKSMKTSADDKISALIRFARLLLPISSEDARSIATDANDVAGEVNAEAIHEITLFAPLAECAAKSMDIDERRRLACDLAIVVGDVGVRIADDGHFPWEDAARAFATLNVCVALAATARWEDSSLVDRATFLPPLLETALSRHEMEPSQVAALSPVLDQFGIELISQIVDETVSQKVNHNQKILAEHLAREELLRFGGGFRTPVTEKLSLLPIEGGPGFWMERLARTTTFHQAMKTNQESASSDEEKKPSQNGVEAEPLDPFGNINWSAHRFVSAEDIHEVIDCIRASIHTSEIHISITDILDRIGSCVALGDRVLHLEALGCCKSSKVADYALAEAIANRVTDWHDVPSVAGWCRERLLPVVADHLPIFSRWLAHGQSPLPALLEKSGLPSECICATLLDAMERHVDVLDAPTIYALVGLVARYCTPVETSQIMSRYVNRLLKRIPIAERDKWDANDIPTEVTGGVARVLYALMGDVDVRSRWQAAHAIRCLALFGDIRTIDKFVELFDETSELSYRKTDAPFYWLSARLWLIIALDRIADETPSAVKHHGSRLLEIATNDEFPHVLIRAFAKSAVFKLVENGNMALSLTQRELLKKVNTSPVRRKKARPSYNVSFDKYRRQGREDHRFHFDSMDTLPYWYSYILDAFADVNMEEFLDVAERWIVDRWGVQSNPWRWDDEPRKHRLSDRQFVSMDHSHGSMPTLERFHTYLEWHAMWCATGELMQKRALAKTTEDNYFTFKRQLDRASLTMSPLWLADLRGPKPLERQLWFEPYGDINDWIDNVSDDDFFTELGLPSNDGTIVVGGSHETGSCKFRSTVLVKTAWSLLKPPRPSHEHYKPYRITGIIESHQTGMN